MEKSDSKLSSNIIKEKKKSTLKIFYFSILILISLILSITWSIRIDNEWGTDYGVYYVGASLLSDQYKLYEDHFDHKGPLLYAFLIVIGDLIGWGPVQAFISLSIIVFLLFISTMILAFKMSNSLSSSFFLILIIGMMLVGQDTNASISVFQTILIILMLFSLVTTNNNHLSLCRICFAGIFWALSVLTRIDSLFYILLIPLAASVSHNSDYKKICTSIVMPITSFFLFLLILSFTLDFSVKAFWACNWEYNREYSKVVSNKIIDIFFRPNNFFLFLQTGIPVYFFAVIAYSNLTWDQWKASIIKYQILISVILLSFFTYLFSRSDKNYHLLIIFPGIISIALFLRINILPMGKAKALLLTFFSLITIFFGYTPDAKQFIKSIKAGTEFHMKKNEDIQIVKLLKSDPDIVTAYGRAWHHLFAGTKPKVGLNCHVIFYQPYKLVPDISDKIEKVAKDIFCNKGIRYLIEREMIEHPTALTSDLLFRSKSISTIGKYELREISSPCPSI